jgi:predicted nucleotidyltransferase
VQIDVYSAYYSDLGIASEEILANQIVKNGFKIPSVELLIVLKLVAWLSRRGTGKGRKDLIDIISLLDLDDFNREKMKYWLKLAKLVKSVEKLRNSISQLSAMEEMGLNQHQIAKRKKIWLERLE